MGARGPIANSSKRNGPRVRRGLPERPAEVTGEAAAEWERVAGELAAAGTLATVDRGILAAYCLALSEMLAAQRAIEEHGRWSVVPMQTPKGDIIGEKTVEHPAVRLLDRASARVQKLAAELGLTPASRARTEAAAPAEASRENKVLAIRERIEQDRAEHAAG